ncbi:hypothetical protein SOV_04950 [Sporomusa ovata DSM 2662]|uniref:Uncharacterized protein n=1 Tax=Sporomusa ovata TaxID=2378 RepID=A0A0U1KWA3_9FIRM|nr:hypothetical protein [Sporomusa ovata]EQB28165.1 hypothetical protein SOV_2c10880 [Sporomusa ovata DSM 2662]CQR71697.1 hypothetical protein SpAn4DRAFT_3563 [Sporomusa ovata]
MVSLTKRQAAILLGVVLLVALLVGWLLYRNNADQEAKLQQATVLTDQQAKDINYLQNALDESKQNAELLAKAVESAQAGKLQPEVRFVVQESTAQAASEIVTKHINQQDQSLPPIALEKTDRTVVVPNEQKTSQANWDVGVFKVNNYKNWYVGTGIGVHEGNYYIPVGAQRNFSKDAAIDVQVHVDTNLKEINGGQVMYRRAVNKLFVLF